MEDELEVYVYLRTGAITGAQERYLMELTQFEERGVIDSLSVRTWPEKIAIRKPLPFPFALKAFRRFNAWAVTRSGISLFPAFDLRAHTDLATDAEQPMLITPTMCLEIRNAGRIVGVYPHTDRGFHLSVKDGLERLATWEFTKPNPARIESSLRCPDCGETTANVQGIHLCDACSWNDRMNISERSVKRPLHTPL